MKRIVLWLVLSSSLLFSSSYTKKEIADYIKLKTEKEIAYYDLNTVIEFKNNYCNITLKEDYIGDYGRVIQIREVNLKKVNVAFNAKDVPWIDLNCIGKKECVNITYNGKDSTNYDIITYTNQATVMKLFNAYEDLIAKCKGIKELY
jgi:hypothetical protein